MNISVVKEQSGIGGQHMRANLLARANGADGGTLVTKTRHEQQALQKTLAVVNTRALDRECFAQSLVAHGIGMEVVAVSSMADWRVDTDPTAPLCAIVLGIGGQKLTDPALAAGLTDLVAEFTGIPVVVLADSDNITEIVKALECGARGYIPTSVGINVCVEAINLARAGGTFVPASTFVTMKAMLGSQSDASRPRTSMFTQRQEEVVRAVCRGKANKIIAYELNLRESTVKVHIRNIMKKLKATNRTEVAYKFNEMFPAGPGPSA